MTPAHQVAQQSHEAQPQGAHLGGWRVAVDSCPNLNSMRPVPLFPDLGSVAPGAVMESITSNRKLSLLGHEGPSNTPQRCWEPLGAHLGRTELSGTPCRLDLFKKEKCVGSRSRAPRHSLREKSRHFQKISAKTALCSQSHWRRSGEMRIRSMRRR